MVVIIWGRVNNDRKSGLMLQVTFLWLLRRDSKYFGCYSDKSVLSKDLKKAAWGSTNSLFSFVECKYQETIPRKISQNNFRFLCYIRCQKGTILLHLEL